MGEVLAFVADTFGNRAHVIVGDLNTFQRDEMAPHTWDGICAHYASAGWPPPAEESLVLRRVTARGYTDAFASWQQSAGANVGGQPMQCAPLTCWSIKPLFRLDYVLLSPPSDAPAVGLRVCSHRTLESPVSDHFPVIVDLEVETLS